MPLQRLLPPRHAGEDGIGLALWRQFHFENADFRRPLRPAGAAQRIGQQLVAQAQAEIGPPEFVDPGADGALFGDQPRVRVHVPYIHRSAHHPQGIEIGERRNGLALIELDGFPLDAVLSQEFAQHAGMFAVDVLEDEKAHGRVPPPPAVSRSAWLRRARD